MPNDISTRWKALNPQERDSAMSRMNPEQKMKLAQALGFQEEALPKPTDTVGPAPPPNTAQWLEMLGKDVGEGGSRTVIGRLLGKMQGRGEKGFTGAQSEASPGQSEMMASIPLGTIKAAQGVAEHKPLKTISGGLQALQLPMAFMGGPAMQEASELAPSAKWAAKMFESVMGDAKDVPVVPTLTGKAILRAQELAQRGASFPQAVSKLLNRMTGAYKGPLTYGEARDFYTNITRLSSEDVQQLNPVMQRQLGILREALKHDIGAAAGQVNRAGDYYAALRDYARSSQLKRTAQWLLKHVGLPAAGAAGAGAAAKVGWDFFHHGPSQGAQ